MSSTRDSKINSQISGGVIKALTAEEELDKERRKEELRQKKEREEQEKKEKEEKKKEAKAKKKDFVDPEWIKVEKYLMFVPDD